MTLGSQTQSFVIQLGETETQRQRRDCPEVPQGIQKGLMWNSGHLSLTQHQFSFREAYLVGTENIQGIGLERNWSAVGSKATSLQG